jgi:parvulin-like peptidyl-prolyl isomerase
MKRVGIILSLVLFLTCLVHSEVINRVLAVVNGEVITELDLINYVRRKHPELRGEELTQEVKDRLIRESLQKLIEDRLILSFGKQKNIPVKKSEIESRIAEIRKNFISDIEFLHALEGDGLSYQGLYQNISDSILKKRVIDLFVRRKIEIHPEELKEYYQNHLDEFVRPERVKIRKIYFKKGKGVEEKIEQIKDLLSKNVPFEDLALNHSDSDTIYLNQGEWIEKGKLSRKVEDVLFSLNPGEISPLVETESGYYIFQVVDKKPSVQMSFEEAQSKIYETIYRKKFSREYQEFIEGLKEDAQIDIKVQ